MRTADQAVRAAERIGYPVVVKPLDGNHGRGVCLDLQDEADVRAAFPIAKEQSRRGVIVVESLIVGKDYRCLVIDGRIAAIAERVPASVTGDGTVDRRAARRHRERRPAPRRRPREGADPDQGRRRGGRAGARAGLRDDRRTARGPDGQARPHRQHVDRRHLDRPHLRGAPGERRDRRGGRPDGRPRHRRHRLHLPRHHRAGARDRRRDLRGQRRARASGCTPTRPSASRSSSPSRSSTCSSRPGAHARGSRSWP